VQAELQRTESGRKLLAEAHAFAKELSEPREVDGVRLRERLKKFRQQYGDQLLAAHAQQAHLQPSVAAVAQILPELAAKTIWVSETSILGSMLLRPKEVPQDVGTTTQGLGGDPPPLVQTCVTPPYGLSEFYLVPAAITADNSPGWAEGSPENGTVEIGGNAYTNLLDPVGTCLASGFVGQDFPVPAGPTSYTTTISYDWRCYGFGLAVFGVAIVNVDLAIVIDKRDGTRETHAREVTLLTVPGIGGDNFNHEADAVTVTIPFMRDGSNGTVRIMVGADGQATLITAMGGGAIFDAQATVRQICLTSVG
jgi:hypothetical protein